MSQAGFSPTTRRSFIAESTATIASATGLAVALVPLDPAGAGERPDAALVAACLRWLSIETDGNALYDADDPGYEAHWEASKVEFRALLASIVATPARTLAGLSAKAQVLRLSLPLDTGRTALHEGDADQTDRLAWSLARDVIAKAGGGGTA